MGRVVPAAPAATAGDARGNSRTRRQHRRRPRPSAARRRQRRRREWRLRPRWSTTAVATAAAATAVHGGSAAAAGGGGGVNGPSPDWRQTGGRQRRSRVAREDRQGGGRGARTEKLVGVAASLWRPPHSPLTPAADALTCHTQRGASGTGTRGGGSDEPRGAAGARPVAAAPPAPTGAYFVGGVSRPPWVEERRRGGAARQGGGGERERVGWGGEQGKGEVSRGRGRGPTRPAARVGTAKR